MGTVTALSDLGFFHKLIKLVMVTFGTLKFTALKLDFPNEVASLFHGLYCTIKFVWVEPNIFHP